LFFIFNPYFGDYRMKTYRKLIPQNDQEFVKLSNNFAKIPNNCCGISEAELAELRTVASDYGSKVEKVDEAQSNYRQAVVDKQECRRLLEGQIRPLIHRMKFHPDYNKGIGAKLGIEGSATVYDLNNSAPNLSVNDKTGGTVEMRFSLRGSDGANLYMQYEQDVEWTLVGRAMTSPFIDIRPLKTPGKLEVRRYTAVYTQKTQEVGRFSEDVVVTCLP